jgi:hypothetical protein
LVMGHPLKVPTILYGPASTGKSILMHEFMYDFLPECNTVYMDCEGGALDMISMWKPVFDKRFGIETFVTRNLEEKHDHGCIYVVEKRNIRGILEQFGYKVDLEITKGGKEGVSKINLRMREYCNNKIKDLVAEHNVGYLLNDSISAPLKIFVGGQTQWGARSDATTLWLTGINEIADDYDTVIYSIAHESFNPINKWELPKIRGPGGLRYAHKIVLYLQPSKSRKMSNLKKLWITRFFDKEGWRKYMPFKLTDEGYKDLSAEELGELKKMMRRDNRKLDKADKTKGDAGGEEEGPATEGEEQDGSPFVSEKED